MILIIFTSKYIRGTVPKEKNFGLNWVTFSCILNIRLIFLCNGNFLKPYILDLNQVIEFADPVLIAFSNLCLVKSWNSSGASTA